LYNSKIIGTWKSSGTLETLELDCKGQNTSHWGVLYIIGKLLKCRCRKWARMGHLDIWSTSYGAPATGIKRPWCVQVKCDTLLESFWGELQVCFKPQPNWSFEQRVMIAQSPRSPNQDSFEAPPWESRNKKSFRCGCCGEAQNILYGGRWWLPSSPNRCGSSESKVARDLS